MTFCFLLPVHLLPISLLLPHLITSMIPYCLFPEEKDVTVLDFQMLVQLGERREL